MSEAKRDPSPLSELNANMEGVLEVIKDMGLNKASAILGEGFCPHCMTRSSLTPVIDPEDEVGEEPDHPKVTTKTAEVNCHGCNTRWRTGGNPENDLPWIELSRPLDQMTLSMALNPPPEPEDDGYWYDPDDE